MQKLMAQPAFLSLRVEAATVEKLDLFARRAGIGGMEPSRSEIARQALNLGLERLFLALDRVLAEGAAHAEDRSSVHE